MSDTRDLSADERGVLEALLVKGSFPGADALEKQVAHARVLCGSPHNFLDLQVDESAEPAPVPDGVAPARALIAEHPGAEPVGEITLWIERGRLSGLEHVSFMDEAPSAFPKPTHVHVQARRNDG